MYAIVAVGVPGYEMVASDGIFAPAGTATTIISRLNQEIVRLVNTAETKERLLSVGAEAVGNSPEQIAAAIKSEIAKMGKLIKDAGTHSALCFYLGGNAKTFDQSCEIDAVRAFELRDEFIHRRVHASSGKHLECGDVSNNFSGCQDGYSQSRERNRG